MVFLSQTQNILKINYLPHCEMLVVTALRTENEQTASQMDDHLRPHLTPWLKSAIWP